MENVAQTPQHSPTPIQSASMTGKSRRPLFKKRLFLIIIGAIFAVAVIFVGLNFGSNLGLGLNFSAYPIPAPDPATANWQVYRNENVWFEIKYPNDWFNITKEEANYEADEKLYEFSNSKIDSDQNKERVIMRLMVSNSQSQKDLVNEILNLKPKSKIQKNQTTYAKISDLTISELAATQYIVDKKEKIIFRIKNWVHTASLEGASNAVKKNRNTFYQILFTFKSQEIDAGDETQGMYACEFDSDCEVVPIVHCCGATKQAINKKWDKFYRTHPEFHIISEAENPEICAFLIGECSDDSQINEAECVLDENDQVKRCQLKY